MVTPEMPPTPEMPTVNGLKGSVTPVKQPVRLTAASAHRPVNMPPIARLTGWRALTMTCIITSIINTAAAHTIATILLNLPSPSFLCRAADAALLSFVYQVAVP